MTAAAIPRLEGYLPIAPGSVRDDTSLRIARTTARVVGEPVPVHEARWVGRCRRMGTATLRRWGLESLVDNAQLLISELVTNALRYGGADDILVRFVTTTDGLVIVVEDGAPASPRVRQAAADDEAGRGMLLVSTLATQWGVSSDGATTWCSLEEDAALAESHLPLPGGAA